MARDAHEAAVATEPEIAGIVRDDLRDDVLDEAVARRDVENAAILQPGESAAQRADPDRAIGIAEQGAHTRGEQTVACIPRPVDFPIRPAVDSAGAAHPERVRSFAHDAGDVAVKRA